MGKRGPLPPRSGEDPKAYSPKVAIEAEPELGHHLRPRETEADFDPDFREVSLQLHSLERPLAKLIARYDALDRFFDDFIAETAPKEEAQEGLATRSPTTEPKEADPRHVRAWQLRQRGVPFSQIARELGVGKATVIRWMGKYEHELEVSGVGQGTGAAKADEVRDRTGLAPDAGEPAVHGTLGGSGQSDAEIRQAFEDLFALDQWPFGISAAD